MRRLTGFAGLALVAVALGIGLSGGTAAGSSTARVDAIFDDAKGLIPGQEVKIAGARVGTISAVTLTPDFKARIEMSIDARFMPFHTDAACAIEPEGLIAENFVNCDPGTPSAPLLRSTAHNAPTVPLNANAEPVSLTDLFNVFNTPTADRFSVLLNELGAGVAGQGQNLNSILHRSNPALSLARKAITLVNGQRTQIQQIITASDPIVARLAAHSTDVQRFLTSAASVASTAANHRSALAQTINRLPGLLEAARPALQQLDVLAAQGAPVLADLHASAPSLNRAINDLVPFSAAAEPALRKIGPALSNTTKTFRTGAPVIAQLRTFAHDSVTPGQLLDQLAVSFRDRGVVENLMAFIYFTSGLLSRFDATSHMSVVNTALANATCDGYASMPVPGCSAWYPNNAQRFAPIHRSSRRAPSAPPAAPSPATSTPTAQPTAPVRAPSQPQSPLGSAVGGVKQLLGGLANQVQGIVNQLLPPPSGGGTNNNASSQNPLQQLLNYLLK